jgi:hypothetical protein
MRQNPKYATQHHDAYVEIPGRFYATYKDGRIVGMTWTPSAGDAGYFGPSAFAYELDSGMRFSAPLDVEDADGPFWRSMQNALAADMPIVWTE